MSEKIHWNVGDFVYHSDSYTEIDEKIVYLPCIVIEIDGPRVKLRNLKGENYAITISSSSPYMCARIWSCAKEQAEKYAEQEYADLVKKLSNAEQVVQKLRLERHHFLTLMNGCGVLQAKYAGFMALQDQ